MSSRRAPLPADDLRHVLDHTRELWDSCRGAQLLITGASGFVGSWLLETALHADSTLDLDLEVTVLVRDAARFTAHFPHLAAARALTCCVGDIRDFEPWRPFSHIVHCASAASPAVLAERPDDVVDIIERGSAHVLDIARAGAGVRLLQMSSGSVYGPQPANLAMLDEGYAGSADESDLRQRLGAAKRRAERRGEAAVADGVGFVSARAFALVGPRLPLDAEFALGNFLGDALAGRPIVLTSDGTVERSWIHMADLAAWSWTMLVRGVPGRAYNVGSEASMSLWDAAHRVAALADPPVPVRRLREPSPGASPSRYIPATARARAELGLDAWIPFDEAIRRTWGWLRNPPT